MHRAAEAPSRPFPVLALPKAQAMSLVQGPGLFPPSAQDEKMDSFPELSFHTFLLWFILNHFSAKDFCEPIKYS